MSTTGSGNQQELLDSSTLDWIKLREDIGAEALKSEETIQDKFKVTS